MFKVLTREKNDIIHKQYDLINSIYFLKEGKIVIIPTDTVYGFSGIVLTGKALDTFARL